MVKSEIVWLAFCLFVFFWALQTIPPATPLKAIFMLGAVVRGYFATRNILLMWWPDGKAK